MCCVYYCLQLSFPGLIIPQQLSPNTFHVSGTPAIFLSLWYFQLSFSTFISILAYKPSQMYPISSYLLSLSPDKITLKTIHLLMPHFSIKFSQIV